LLKHTPISALTANVIKGARERGLGSGFDSFLGKPIVIKELEKVFKMFLKSDVIILDSPQNIIKNNAIVGVDAKMLTQELMLTHEELIMLLELFIAKMKKQLPELRDAIEAKDYKKIASIAHSIKGSSSNFRVESIFKNSADLEKMAREESNLFDHMSIFQKIQKRVEEIKIGS
jgi:HPt (histidine-containing phosphotransfer) domain-containing protein